jgi:hypothetical protein
MQTTPLVAARRPRYNSSMQILPVKATHKL